MADFAQKIRYTIDIDSGLVTAPQRAQLTKGDRSANKIVVTVTEKGEPFDLSGVTVSGRFYRPPDAAEVTLGGSAAGNVATVVFNDHCYTAEGYYEAEVVLTQGSIKRTILSISGHVHYGGGGAYIDIENVVPSLDDIIALYSEMRTETNRCIAAADRAENMQMDASGMAGDSNMLGGKAPEYYIQAHNLLDNSWWSNKNEIVNQRRSTSYTGTVYGIDRWYGRATAQNVTVKSKDITITATDTAYAGIKQKIGNIESYVGKKVTLAAYVYSTVSVAVGFTDASDTAISETINAQPGTNLILCTCAVPSGATADTFIPRILLRTTAPNDYMRCYWAALYEGEYTAETLPPYTQKGYGPELAECQRYYISVRPVAGFVNKDGTGAYFPIGASVQMRAVPKVESYSITSMRLQGKSISSGSVTSVTNSSVQIPIPTAYVVADGLGEYGNQVIIFEGIIGFSADL